MKLYRLGTLVAALLLPSCDREELGDVGAKPLKTATRFPAKKEHSSDPVNEGSTLGSHIIIVNFTDGIKTIRKLIDERDSLSRESLKDGDSYMLRVGIPRIEASIIELEEGLNRLRPALEREKDGDLGPAAEDALRSHDLLRRSLEHRQWYSQATPAK